MLYLIFTILAIVIIVPLVISSTVIVRLLRGIREIWIKTEIFDAEEIYSSD